jgi:hypothetical protein
VGVEKVRHRNVVLAAIMAAIEFFLSPQLGGSFHRRGCRLAEEPHEPPDVLCHGCQEELLAHELQSAQAQATQSDLILEFREQGPPSFFPAVPWRTLVYSPTPVRVDGRIRPCGWQESEMRRWCIGL